MKKTCHYCVHATIETGDRTVGEFGEYAMCENPEFSEEKLEEVGEIGDSAAETCTGFSPVLVETCGICKASINQPLRSWELWGACYWGDPEPVCSEACQREAKKQVEAEQQKEQEYEAYLKSPEFLAEKEESDRQAMIDRGWLDPVTGEPTNAYYVASDIAFDAARESRHRR